MRGFFDHEKKFQQFPRLASAYIHLKNSSDKLLFSDHQLRVDEAGYDQAGLVSIRVFMSRLPSWLHFR
jgi:hypothetical protein